MKLIEPTYQILEPQGYDYKGICKMIELAGRTCYKSEDKITDDSAKPFVQKMIDSGHLAMLEHGTVYLKFDWGANSTLAHNEWEGYWWQPPCSSPLLKYKNNKYSKYFVTGSVSSNQKTKPTKVEYVTTNLRVIKENGWIKDLFYACEPTEYHTKRVSVKFTCTRQVAYEFVRHRVFSFAQESTRFNNYCKGKYGSELSFIAPCWPMGDEESMLYQNYLLAVEDSYKKLINLGWSAQKAAQVLPNCLKTELIMTGYLDQDGWEHFFDLRAKGTTGTPHPQAKQLAQPLMEEFLKRGWI